MSATDPHVITLDQVADLIRGLGIDPADVTSLVSVHIDPGVVTVVRMRRNGDGNTYVAGETVAREVTTIRREGGLAFAPADTDTSSLPIDC